MPYGAYHRLFRSHTFHRAVVSFLFQVGRQTQSASHITRTKWPGSGDRATGEEEAHKLSFFLGTPYIGVEGIDSDFRSSDCSVH